MPRGNLILKQPYSVMVHSDWSQLATSIVAVHYYVLFLSREINAFVRLVLAMVVRLGLGLIGVN